jgi:hypothetical protein
VGVARTLALATVALSLAVPAAARAATITTTPKDSTGNSRNLHWDFDALPVGTSCELTGPEGQVDQIPATCTSPYEFTLAAGAPDGQYTFTVTDLAGSDSATYTLDTFVATPSVTGSPASPGNDPTPAWQFSPGDSEAVTFECRLQPASSTFTPCASGDGLATAGDGRYTFELQAVDGLGNRSAPVSRPYTLDTTAPAAPAITGGPPERSSEQSAAFTFTAESGSATECRLERDGAVAFDWTACSSPWSYGLLTQPDGSYLFSVRARDQVGNTGPAATRGFVLDRSVPGGQPQEAPGPLLRPGVCVNLFEGTARADRITGSEFGDVLLGAAGNDRLDGAGGDDCVLGDEDDDLLLGGPGNDDVRGLVGDDVLRGGRDNDRLAGGTGDDRASGSLGDDRVTGGTGADRLSGGAGTDTLLGGTGMDTLAGGAGADILRSGSGNDSVSTRDGAADQVNCGAGADRVKADRSDKLKGCEKRSFRRT